jgi:uncharacterized repeat protein (TIGR01451 family)
MNMRKLAALLGALALSFSAATTVLATGESVNICHASDSETNPYISESPAIDSTGYLHGGHQDHTGPVWYPGAKDDDVVWGDIIPPYTYDTGNGIFSYPGLNWDTAGRAIYDNGCNPFPAIHVEKTASVDTLDAGGGDVTYTYAVTNIGQVPLTSVTVTDDKCSAVTLQSGDTNSNNKLDLTESWTFTCNAHLTATTTNVGTATGHDGDHTVTDTDEATVTVAASGPAIHVVKSADPGSLQAGGGPVEYTYLVTNSGNVDLTGVTVSDNKCSTVTGPTGDSGNDGVLGQDETWSYTCTMSLTETTTNTVTATGHDGETQVSDTDTLTVTVAAPGGGVQGETSPPRVTAPPTDSFGNTSSDSGAGGSLTLLLTVMGFIGLGAVLLTTKRNGR